MLTVLFSAKIRRTKFGTGLVAIREDEGKAASIGVNTTRFKVVGIRRQRLLHRRRRRRLRLLPHVPEPGGRIRDPRAASMIVLAALAGGKGTLYGPVVGAFIVQHRRRGRDGIRRRQPDRVLLFGAALVAVVLFMPAGLLPTVEA